jgi:hypothetical protein
MGCTANEYGFDSLQGRDIFLMSTESRAALGRNQPPPHCVQGLYARGLSFRRVKLTAHLHLVLSSRMAEL